MTIEKPVRIPKPAGPTPQEASDLNRGRKKSRLSRLAGSKLADLTLAVTAAAGALQIAHTINPDIPSVPGLYQDIRQGMGNLVPDKEPPSKGDFFNPKASSGEISRANITFIPINEALAKAHNESTKSNTMVLPLLFDPGDSLVHYEVGSDALQNENIIRLTDVKVGTVFYAPADGQLSWQTDDSPRNGGYHDMFITIKDIKLPWTTPENTKGAKTKLVFSARDFELLIPQESFTVRTTISQIGPTTKASSSVPVRAGQPIFRVKTEQMMDIFGEKSQMTIGGMLVGTEGTASYSKDHGPSFSKLSLPFSSIGDKVVAVSPTQ